MEADGDEQPAMWRSSIGFDVHGARQRNADLVKPFALLALSKAGCYAYQLPTTVEVVWVTSQVFTLSDW